MGKTLHEIFPSVVFRPQHTHDPIQKVRGPPYRRPGSKTSGAPFVARQSLRSWKRNAVRGVPSDRVAPEIEEEILALCLDRPTWGAQRVANELRQSTSSTRRGVWLRHDLAHRSQPLRLEKQAQGEKSRLLEKHATFACAIYDMEKISYIMIRTGRHIQVYEDACNRRRIMIACCPSTRPSG